MKEEKEKNYIEEIGKYLINNRCLIWTSIIIDLITIPLLIIGISGLSQKLDAIMNFLGI